MAGKLYVMRHGKTVLDDEHRSDGWLDYPLSDEGRIGLIDAQQYLKHAPVSCVVTCSLRRCAETAHIIASGIMTHPPVGINDMTRTWNLGTIVGTKKSDNKPRVKYLMANPDELPEKGETLNTFRKRFETIMQELLSEVKAGKTILLVCSGSAIREISLTLCGNHEELDLQESGLICLTPKGNKIQADVILGSKEDDRGYWS